MSKRVIAKSIKSGGGTLASRKPDIKKIKKKMKEKYKLPSKKMTVLEKLESKLQNAMTAETRKKLKADIAKLKKPTTKTLVKEQKKQANLNTNQKTGLKTNKIVKGDETKDALKTAPLTQKELKDKGMVSGSSEFRLAMSSLKGKAKALADQVKKKKELLDKLSSSDRAGEKGMLLRNAIKDMQKKLKGQAPITTLRNAGLMNKGGLAPTKPTQTGLKKLPTAVRNKMGYMYGGGMANKKKVTNMDYRKGGLVIMIGQAKPMKKGKK